MAVNSKGHIFVYSRGNSTGPAYAATAAQLLEFGPDGKYIREIGKNLYAWSFAHAVRVDKDDNIWAVDKGSDMMIKFNPEGRVVMVFGRKKEASDEGAEAWKHPRPPLPAVDGQFRQPTDVTWDPQGNIFFSDGYINSRIAKYDKNGRWVKSWGTPGNKQGEFNTPHSITSDAKGNIYVADRGNRRIQVFDSDGGFLREIKINVPVPPDAQPWMGARPPQGEGQPGTMQSGAPWAVCISPGSDAVPVRFRCISGACLQDDARRQSGRRSGQHGPPVERVRVDPRDRLSLRKYDLCRGASELASAEADPASGEAAAADFGEKVSSGAHTSVNFAHADL